MTPGYCLPSRSDAVAPRRRTSSAFDLHHVCIVGRMQQPGSRGENAGASPKRHSELPRIARRCPRGCAPALERLDSRGTALSPW